MACQGFDIEQLKKMMPDFNASPRLIRRCISRNVAEDIAPVVRQKAGKMWCYSFQDLYCMWE
jgi:hypothetical protein